MRFIYVNETGNGKRDLGFDAAAPPPWDRLRREPPSAAALTARRHEKRAARTGGPRDLDPAGDQSFCSSSGSTSNRSATRP